jgi:hypothetical protein
MPPKNSDIKSHLAMDAALFWSTASEEDNAIKFGMVL